MLKLLHGATYLVSAILVELDLHTLRLEPFDITVQTGEITFDIDLHPRLRIILQKTLVIGQLPVHLPQFGLQRDRNIDAATFERLDLRLDLTQILSDEPQTDILTVTDAVPRIQVGETLLEIGTLKTGRLRDRTLLQLLDTVVDLAKHLDGTLVLVKVEPVPVVPLHGGHVGLRDTCR